MSERHPSASGGERRVRVAAATAAILSLIGGAVRPAEAAIPDGIAKNNGQAVGMAAATLIILSRAGVYCRTPAAYAAPQTPWVGDVKPFVLGSADQFLPDARFWAGLHYRFSGEAVPRPGHRL